MYKKIKVHIRQQVVGTDREVVLVGVEDLVQVAVGHGQVVLVDQAGGGGGLGGSLAVCTQQPPQQKKKTAFSWDTTKNVNREHSEVLAVGDSWFSGLRTVWPNDAT